MKNLRKELYTEILIDAPANTVWNLLMDFDRFPEWNPFIKKIAGKNAVGEKLEVTIQPPGGSAMNFRPIVQQSVPNQEFRWLGRLAIPGIFDGEHIFELHAQGNKTRLIQKEQFKGILVPFLWKSLDQHTRLGFEQMNTALKQQAEAQVTQTIRQD